MRDSGVARGEVDFNLMQKIDKVILKVSEATAYLKRVFEIYTKNVNKIRREKNLVLFGETE